METEQVASSTAPASILAIEDDQDTAEFLRLMLKDAGYSVTTAGSGSEALGLLDDTAPDLVLMDIMLPGIDGYTLTKRIRDRSGNAIPIIMLTAADQPTSRLKGFDVGADDFVVKPFDSSELLARIAVQLRWSSSKRSLEDQSDYLRQALEIMARQQEDIQKGSAIEQSMRVDLLRSVNTHLQSLCRIFDNEYRRQPPGPGREALLRVIPRLHSAALVYRITDQLTGETAAFTPLLRSIAASIKNIHPQQKRVAVSVEAEPLELPTMIASPLATAVSELVTNAFKHAFPGNHAGTITIKCWMDGGEICLEVLDDGTGLPEGSAVPSRGLQAIRQLVTDLGGTFTLTSNATGTRAAIRAPLKV
jgi:two-component system sensor histidine kinase/response regulator